MAKIIRKKELVNARILKEYASWIYCNSCNETVAYLCYSGYNAFDFEFDCNCGAHGSVVLHVNEPMIPKIVSEPLSFEKNRYCCNDNTKLFSLVDNRLSSYNVRVVCEMCSQEYTLKR